MQEKEFQQKLVQRYAEDKATGEELEVFFHLLRDGQLDTHLSEAMEDEANKIMIPVAQTAHRVHFLKTSWFRYAAAVILLVGGTIAYVISTKEKSQPLAAGNKQVKQDIAPGTNRAILTVGNKAINLSTNKTGIAVAGDITYNDGEKVLNRVRREGELLQLTTPRGGQYQAVLPDGTKVWLNAASSIKFPAVFSGATRNVEMTGEVYMEIAKNSKQPFIVKANEMEVQVLGTSFNVNAYSDESVIKATLIEGRIKVVKENREAILQPGEQAVINNSAIQKVLIQTDEVLAWKSGLFKFNEVSIEVIMRQLARWYNLEVEYNGKVNTTFLSTIPRNVPLSQVLEALELTKAVKFHVHGNKVTVIGQ